MPSTWSQDIYIKAYKFAVQAHWNDKMQQVVPGTGIPYLMHISMVAMEVIAALAEEPGLDGDLTVQCALLHDTLEDTDTTCEQLVEKFGYEVADGVAALTKDETIDTESPKEMRKKTPDGRQSLKNQESAY